MLGFTFLLSFNVVFSQKTLTGKITDSQTGEPVLGSTIAVRGSTTATQTDNNGAFTITVPNNINRLTISSVGYEPQEILMGNRTQININLKSDTKALGEVVVVGYGTQRAKDVTGSVATINQTTIKDLPVSTIFLYTFLANVLDTAPRRTSFSNVASAFASTTCFAVCPAALWCSLISRSSREESPEPHERVFWRGALSRPPPPSPPVKHSRQSTGRSPVGLKGTWVCLPHWAHVTSKSSS